MGKLMVKDLMQDLEGGDRTNEVIAERFKKENKKQDIAVDQEVSWARQLGRATATEMQMMQEQMGRATATEMQMMQEQMGRATATEMQMMQEQIVSQLSQLLGGR